MNGFDLVHGGALDQVKALYAQAPVPWLDLSTGINPHSYPIPQIPIGAFAHLPMRSAVEACRGAMAGYCNVAEESMLLVPGTEILIRILPSLLKVRTVAIAEPTYGDHSASWKRSGVRVSSMTDPACAAGEVDAIVLCNPNNPDGRTWSPDILEHCRSLQAGRRGWLIVDEAYADLVPGLSLARHGGQPGLIILRSFGKFFGLAGLRLGALIGPEEFLAEAREVFGVWPVSGPALHIGQVAAADRAWQEAARLRLGALAAQLDNALAGAGLTVCGGTDLFRYVKVSDAHALWHKLAEQGIYVRRFAWSGQHLRIGLPADETAVARLTSALKA